jgi:dTDP-4-dehydrorhamnose 3,5-epimerase-like enzyme
MNDPKAYPIAAAAGRIVGVKTKPLRLVPDERGWLMEILRADDSELFARVW